MARCLIALGSNLGTREQLLDQALFKLNAQPGVQVVAHSDWFSTAPVGGPAGQGQFLNGAAVLETSLEPVVLCEVLQQIENELGRQRSEVWGARTLDLDLLLYEQQVVNDPHAIVPHPRMTFRRFVLEPAAQIASEMRHPVTGSTIGELLKHLNTAPNYLAIAGADQLAKARLARRLQQEFGATLVLADQPGLAPSNSISFWSAPLEQLTRQLCQAAPQEMPMWLVSDFWVGELLAQASGELSGQDRTEVEAWRQTCLQIPVPKLVVFLENAADDNLKRLPAVESLPEMDYRGPRLHLHASNPDEAYRQTRAALLAME